MFSHMFNFKFQIGTASDNICLGPETKSEFKTIWSVMELFFPFFLITHISSSVIYLSDIGLYFSVSFSIFAYDWPKLILCD